MIPFWALRVAEILVGGFFLGFGIANTRSSATIIETLKSRGFFAASGLFWLGVGTQSIAGGLLVAGFKAPLMAGALIPFTMIAPLIFHNFWTMEGEARFLNRIIFISDYTCALAVLLLIASSDQQFWVSLLSVS
jgi:putative oxidoreductase